MNNNGNNLENGLKRSAAHLPFKTFLSIIVFLATHGIPHRIDRSVFRQFSGATATQAFIGLRFLGLMDDDGVPTAMLATLVNADDDQRRVLLGDLLRKAYPALFELDLTKATAAQFEQALGSNYNVSGSTRTKAARFFLSAAEYAGVPVSPFMERAKGPATPGTPRRRRAAAAPKGKIPLVAAPVVTLTPSPGAQIMMRFASAPAEELRVVFTGNPFVLSAEDRKFLNGILDSVQRYGEANAVEPDGEALP
jgi:hypothetical protein